MTPFFGTVKFKKTHPDAKMPSRKHEQDAGNDLYAVGGYVSAFPGDERGRYEIDPGEIVKINTGVAVSLPPHTEGTIMDRSSMGLRGFKVLAGQVDVGFVGTLQVVLVNLSDERQVIYAGDRVAQLVVRPVIECTFEEVQELEASERGTSGFGSTGA